MRTLAALLIGATLLVAGPAHAAIRIVKVQYDSPGSDTGSNSSLNAEYVVIKNTGNRRKTLTGWTLRDTSSHVYRFGTFRLRPGRTVTVHTGKGSNTAAHRYWNAGYYVWNNTGDKAILKSKAGKTLDTCKWGDGPGSITC